VQERRTIPEKVVDIMEILLSLKDGGSIRDISSLTALPRSTVHRILSSLQGSGWAFQDVDQKYRISSRFLVFANEWRLRKELVKQSDPAMRNLVAVTGQTVILAIPENTCLRCIHKIESDNFVKYIFEIGGELPNYAGALGKLLLAYSSDEYRNRILSSPLKPLTDFTITDPDRLMDEVHRTRERGYASSIQEIDHGAAAFAAPIFSIEDTLLACLLISGSLNTMLENRDLFVSSLLEASGCINAIFEH